MASDTAVTVVETNTQITFQPTSNHQATGLLFYPGAIVEPTAYAPLARTLAEAGYLTIIVKLPWGTAPLASHEEHLWETTQTIMAQQSDIQQWVLSGHSRGAAIAARTVYEHEDAFAGLILIGTSHPKEAVFSLAGARLPVTKIYGTEDGLASQVEIEAFRGYLPEHTVMKEISGGNHAQFGYYGRQLGDNSATISREEQQRETAVAILSFLDQLNP